MTKIREDGNEFIYKTITILCKHIGLHFRNCNKVLVLRMIFFLRSSRLLVVLRTAKSPVSVLKSIEVLSRPVLLSEPLLTV